VALLVVGLIGSGPAQLVNVVPPDGSVSSRVETIGANLDFTRGARADPRSLRLLVDGVDVTARSTIRMSRDWPPSVVSILYRPTGLQDGVHYPEVRFRTEDRAVSYTWTFSLRQRGL
jgi:hypothetical protein